jgi:hypothetical protein
MVKYNYKYQVKEDEIGKVHSKNRERKIVCRVLIGNPEGKGPLKN